MFEKLLEKLEEHIVYDTFDQYKEEPLLNLSFEKVEDIINEVEEEYESWVPVYTEVFPKDNSPILLSFENLDYPLVGRYEEDEDGGAFYLANDNESCVSHNLIVNAWSPVKKPFREC